MSRIVIVSNRLPYNIRIEDTKNKLHITQSVGGLATGMKSVYKEKDSIWIGWPGVTIEELASFPRDKVYRVLSKFKCVPVLIESNDIDLYYYGFSNNAIWPLFHYFTEYTEFNNSEWIAYKNVNKRFAKEIINHLRSDDRLWIHDYHLMLLPNLIKKEMPDITIGYFLHIPFPSFEVFRILPCRNKLLEGMLGADLIGFHTYDYERHFLSSVRRLLGYDIHLNKINLENRIVKVDSFPMGIDYEKFHNAALRNLKKPKEDKSKIRNELDKHLIISPGIKLILSIDRLDYTKGIANRLEAFDFFLGKYPEFKEKVTLVMLSVPSRSNVEQYKLMKSEVDELVGSINGKYATINWIPVWYFYRSLPFDSLIDLYTSCDVALLTPIRDGMNLVAKEYIACKVEQKGVLILSEMAGSSKEMSEALIVNPHNYEEIADRLKEALTMPEDEQIKKNTIMQERLKRYNIKKWANDFLDQMKNIEALKDKFIAKNITAEIEESIISDYKNSSRRIMFLDYDGTLVGFQSRPEMAIPDKELYTILDKLARDNNNEIVLISGRDKDTFTSWFKGKKYSLIAEHGVWSKVPGSNWELIEQLNSEWKEIIKPVIEFYVDRTPGTFMEEKEYSLVWHYRKSDPELGVLRANELKDELTSLTANYNIDILEGNKVIEIKNSGINKGKAALNKLNEYKYDFILGIGDDWTDEYLFEELPGIAITVKVGISNTLAKYNVNSFNEVRELLNKLLCKP